MGLLKDSIISGKLRVTDSVYANNIDASGNLTQDGKQVGYMTSTPTTNKAIIADGTTGGIKTASYGIGPAAEKEVDTAITSGNANLVTSTGIKNYVEAAIDTAITQVLNASY